MAILKNISTLYTCKQDEIYPIKNAAIVWKYSAIEWVGTEEDLPLEYQHLEKFDANGCIVIPGLIDCHTHLAFGGWRADEFEMRLKGSSYLEISRAGGGILSTVSATRLATEDELFEKAFRLLQSISKLGVTAIECKSGYGLTPEDEIKQLRVYKRLKNVSPLIIKTTFLGAHTIPSEFRNNRRKYLDLIINKMIPQVAEENLADFCDVFVEDSAFMIDEAREVLITGAKFGLKPKIHADQLTPGGGAELAAEVGAISADHLEQISETGIQKMAEAGVVAVNLPIASLYTQQPYLDCRKLIDAGLNVAVATDFNPGSAPSFDLHLAMMLSCNHGRLTPAECLKAVTFNAAKAIDISKQTGSIEAGKRADFVLIDAPDLNFWLYHFHGTQIKDVFAGGIKLSLRN